MECNQIGCIKHINDIVGYGVGMTYIEKFRYYIEKRDECNRLMNETDDDNLRIFYHNAAESFWRKALELEVSDEQIR